MYVRDTSAVCSIICSFFVVASIYNIVVVHRLVGFADTETWMMIHWNHVCHIVIHNFHFPQITG